MNIPARKLAGDKANAARLGYVGKRPGSIRRDSDSWFTPPQYLVAVRTVLGRIDLDPFSSDVANLTVGAKHYYTESDDAFTKSWLAGSVFMNPPYGRLCRPAVEKFVGEFLNGHFTAGIVLVNNATETRFFQLLLQTAAAVVFTNHRISFTNADGKRISGNTRGQAFFYFGKAARIPAFAVAFSQFGKVISL
jgi:phage N-6-adenine-methyltransferase